MATGKTQVHLDQLELTVRQLRFFHQVTLKTISTQNTEVDNERRGKSLEVLQVYTESEEREQQPFGICMRMQI